MNVLDIPWVPVIHRARGAETLGLRDALVQSPEITGLGDSLTPVERDALLRFLVSITALVKRRSPRAGLRDRAAVETVLAEHADRFDLLHADEPFLQEWHVTDEQRAAIAPGKVLGLEQLDLHAPGSSTSPWLLRMPDPSASEPGTIARGLVTGWFHRKLGNTAGPQFYRRMLDNADKWTKVSAGAPAGAVLDTSFYLIADTLADTLALNCPASWARSTVVPAWLDQDALPSSTDLTSGTADLWRATWSPNRPLLLHEDGMVSGFVIGTTARPVPTLADVSKIKMPKRKAPGPDGSEADDLELYDRTCVKKHLTAIYPYPDRWTTVLDGQGKPVRVTSGPSKNAEVLDLTSTRGLVHWYSHMLDEALGAWRRAAGPGSRTARVGIFVEASDGTNGMRFTNRWFELDVEPLTLAASRDRTILVALAHEAAQGITSLAPSLRSEIEDGKKRLNLWALANGRDKNVPSAAAKTQMYAGLDEVFVPALAQLIDGDTDEEWLRGRALDLATTACRTFEVLTEPLINPKTVPDIARARAAYRRYMFGKLNDAFPKEAA